MNDCVRVVQLTDTHLFADPNQKLLGIKTYETFKSVVNKITADHAEKLDLLLLTGDLAQDESAGAYNTITQALADVQSLIAFIPGNHDDDAIMQQHLRFKHQAKQQRIIRNNWVILMVNSHWSKHVEGYLEHETLDYIEETLVQYPKHHIALVLHHHLLPVGSAWLDKLKLYNAPALLELVENYANIRLVLSGHVHQSSVQTKYNTLFLTTPSSCFQFKPYQQEFTLDDIYPGYRWLNLYEDGNIETEVVRVPVAEQADTSLQSY